MFHTETAGSSTFSSKKNLDLCCMALRWHELLSGPLLLLQYFFQFWWSKELNKSHMWVRKKLEERYVKHQNTHFLYCRSQVDFPLKERGQFELYQNIEFPVIISDEPKTYQNAGLCWLPLTVTKQSSKYIFKK